MRKTSQRTAQCVFWFIIALLFLVLSIAHFMEIGQHIDGIEERVLLRGLTSSPGSGGESTDVFGAIDNAIVSMDDRIGQLNHKNDSTNRLAGWGYLFAMLAALASGAFSLRKPAAHAKPLE